MEIRKLPRLRPTTSKCAMFSAPPELEAFWGLPPPESSAMSGARFFASRVTLSLVPRTWTVRRRSTPGAIGEESASRESATKTTSRGGPYRFAQEMSTEARPGGKSGGGRMTTLAGDEASTKAGSPEMVIWLASASPQKPRPVISKRSDNEAILGMESTSMAFGADSAWGRIVTGTRPSRPTSDPKIVPGVSGATKRARPVLSVMRRSPFENLIAALGVRRPLMSSTASVARSPEMIVRGRRRMRPACEDCGGAGGFWAKVEKNSGRSAGARLRHRRTSKD